MINPFKEPDGSFSWRKAGTALCFATFATACVGNLITHDFAVLPGSYVGIIAGVFGFYFGKRIFEGVKLAKDAPVQPDK